MDAAGPLCILLQHLQSDPGSVTERSAIDLILKSLRLLGHAVASVNKQHRQEIVKSCNITDVTQLAKQSDPMQTYLFGESKASELNFVGDLAEKVSKAVHSKKNASSNKAKSPYKQARTNSFKGSSGSSTPRNLSSHEHQPFRRAPFRGKREPARDYPYQSRYKIPEKKTSTQTVFNKPNPNSKVSSVDTIFHFPTSLENIHSQMVAGRLQFFSQNWQHITQDPWVLQTVQGYEIELLDCPWQSRIPSPPVLSPTQTYLVVEEIRNLLQKGAILEVPFNPNVGFYSNLFLVEKKVGAGMSINSLAQFQQVCEILPPKWKT